jgi:hypothetical protein
MADMHIRLRRRHRAAPDGLAVMIEKKICAMFGRVPGGGVKCGVILGLLASRARASGLLVVPSLPATGGAGRRPARGVNRPRRRPRPVLSGGNRGW